MISSARAVSAGVAARIAVIVICGPISICLPIPAVAPVSLAPESLLISMPSMSWAIARAPKSSPIRMTADATTSRASLFIWSLRRRNVAFGRFLHQREDVAVGVGEKRHEEVVIVHLRD